MDEQEWMRRIDEHLEISKDYMREGNELMARIDQTMERNREELARNRVAFQDLRTYLQQATEILGGLLAELRAGQQDHEVWREESRAWRRETREWHRSLGEKVDRLRNDPPPAAA